MAPAIASTVVGPPAAEVLAQKEMPASVEALKRRVEAQQP